MRLLYASKSTLVEIIFYPSLSFEGNSQVTELETFQCSLYWQIYWENLPMRTCKTI